ncbi:MAG: YkgJ family cysteine cluster protein [Candidatus Aramenus sp.]|jgi:Fe-S-cluster containining protein|nr:YkgJ family cysteine cluster protein [Candidatus Aramenus sp.]
MIDVIFLNKLTKSSLKGDVKAFRDLLDALRPYLGIPQVKPALYSVVYQIAMNSLIDVSEYCRKCGGKCCRSGNPVPVFPFDYEEMKLRMPKLELKKQGEFYLLPRPCPYQDGWKCKIHNFKPYACLSFPFSTEDEQKEVIDNYAGGIPSFMVPDYCIAGKKVKEVVDEVTREMERGLGRAPSPLELLEELVKRFGGEKRK